MTKRALVAGATGYLGGELVKELKARGYWVRALIRNSSQRDKVALADEVFIGEITIPQSIKGATHTIDYVFSTLGITRQKEGMTYMDVDYQGNLNLLHEACITDVERFLYVSAINGDKLRHLKIFEAKEGFVDKLKESGLDYRVIRPNGFFSDMRDFLEMAKSGRVYLFGKGDKKLNPIDGGDLAKVCIDKMQGTQRESSVGGPDIVSHRELALLALNAWGKKEKIIYIPDCIRVCIIKLLRLFTSSKIYGPYEFFLTAMKEDNIAPCYGEHRLKDFFNQEGVTHRKN
ncbi:SDR family oxidoreductase [Myroides odoratimimus]|uniref:SDR family oxidoreductase n=1 Tax=Myroides odoratimimus TaxID=76832 RepID=UPI002DBE32BF|nr:SDR family oxidoreductase [Myroides odoratimimus]MEC4028370.1 SDR family oxidoreductase [Myroides odoratimimus]